MSAMKQLKDQIMCKGPRPGTVRFVDCGFDLNSKSDVKCDGVNFECDEECDGGTYNMSVITTEKKIKRGSLKITNFIGGEIFQFTLVYEIKTDNDSPITVINSKNVARRHTTFQMNRYRDVFDFIRLCADCKNEIIINSPLINGIKNQLQKNY